MSGNTVKDTVKTFGEAEKKCINEGARLIQPRSYEFFSSITEARKNHFEKDDGEFLKFFPGSLVAVGMKFEVNASTNMSTITYR